MSQSTLVVKIGGSLLGTPEGMQRVAAWLDQTRQPGQTRLLIAGGGPSVDGLRAIDAANPLPEEASHWAAIEMMDVHTRLLPAWLPGVQLLADIPQKASAGDFAVLAKKWICQEERNISGETLRTGWRTTSDAIAVRLAACYGWSAVILKRCEVSSYAGLVELSESGVLDPEVPRLVGGDVRVLGLFPQQLDC